MASTPTPPTASQPNEEQQSPLIDSPIHPEFGPVAFIKVVDINEGSDAGDEDLECAEQVVKQVFLGKTPSTDVLAFRAKVASVFGESHAGSFKLMVKLPGGDLTEAPLEDLVGKNFSRNVELFMVMEEEAFESQHFKAGRIQVKDPSKSTHGQNHKQQLTHEQTAVMHAGVNDFCRAHPDSGVFYGFKDPKCDLVAVSRVISKSKKDPAFKSHPVPDRTIKRAIGKYLNQSKKTLTANKLRAAREQERLKREAAAPAAAPVALPPSPAAQAEVLVPAPRLRKPSSKAADLVAKVKAGKTLTPNEKRKQTAEKKKAAKAAAAAAAADNDVEA